MLLALTGCGHERRPPRDWRDDRPRSIMRSVFERFTEGARQVVVVAQEEARTIGHDYIGTEHLLLGLLREQHGVAAQALASLGVRFEDARAQVVRVAGSGETTTLPQIPFTRRAKQVLELAVDEATELGDRKTDTAHILLALVREGSGVAWRDVLLPLGVDANSVRAAVAAARDARRPQRPQRSRPTPPVHGSPAPFADWLGRLLVDAAARAQGSGRPDGGDLLIALARDRGAVAARALGELGVSEEQLYAAVQHVRDGDPPGPNGN